MVGGLEQRKKIRWWRLWAREASCIWFIMGGTCAASLKLLVFVDAVTCYIWTLLEIHNSTYNWYISALHADHRCKQVIWFTLFSHGSFFKCAQHKVHFEPNVLSRGMLETYQFVQSVIWPHLNGYVFISFEMSAITVGENWWILDMAKMQHTLLNREVVVSQPTIAELLWL